MMPKPVAKFASADEAFRFYGVPVLSGCSEEEEDYVNEDVLLATTLLQQFRRDLEPISRQATRKTGPRRTSV